MLAGVRAGGGTMHLAALRALHRDGVTIPDGAKLIVIVVGDEAGESGDRFADAFGSFGFRPDAMALILNVAHYRGSTVVDAAAHLGIPCSTVTVDQFDDPYQVSRVLQTILEAPVAVGAVQAAWVEKVMSTKLIDIA
jgi:hypothetical protein